MEITGHDSRLRSRRCQSAWRTVIIFYAILIAPFVMAQPMGDDWMFIDGGTQTSYHINTKTNEVRFGEGAGTAGPVDAGEC